MLLPHGTREILIIYGALLSSDPGDIQETIANLITDRIPRLYSRPRS